MNIYVVTIFPEMFDSVWGVSIIKRAQERGLVNIETVNLRDFTTDKHRTTDDYPYGGGAGMLMKVEPIYRSLEYIKRRDPHVYRVLLSPQGRLFTQRVAEELSGKGAIALVCGRYEGFDERVKHFVDDELSIGKFVLSGGEIAAMVIVDAVVRLIPEVLGNRESLREESFNDGLLEYPQYTRPREFMGLKVPEVLLSGNHRAIKEWRLKKAQERTLMKAGEADG